MTPKNLEGFVAGKRNEEYRINGNFRSLTQGYSSSAKIRLPGRGMLECVLKEVSKGKTPSPGRHLEPSGCSIPR